MHSINSTPQPEGLGNAEQLENKGVAKGVDELCKFQAYNLIT
jgi:hypothetical protein